MVRAAGCPLTVSKSSNSEVVATCRIRLIHWNAAEAEERARRLPAGTFAVDYDQLDPAGLRRLWQDPPDAVVVDLSRLPSHGRDVAVGLRSHKDTRRVPLVFAGGDPRKVAGVRELLPDAVYTSWDQIVAALHEAIASPPTDPVVPASTMAGYGGTPLPKKLGIKEGSLVGLVGAPDGFETTLGDLPQGAVIVRLPAGTGGSLDPRPDVTLWFTTRRADLESRIAEMCSRAEKGGLWIIWPKKASGVVSDVSQAVVRQTGLAAGLVDSKVCAVDATWSGLRFTIRKKT